MIKNTIIPLLIVLSFAFGAYFYIDDWKADAEELAMVKERLDKKILKDDVRSLRQDIRDYDKAYGEGCERCEEVVKDKYDQATDDLKDLEKEIEQYREGG